MQGICDIQWMDKHYEGILKISSKQIKMNKSFLGLEWHENE